ncbi:CGNR zinc finger domain-containing protein [Kitasatospora paranensis]|uniref:CGNR zinc finger domain-containing protein n=1 Tax=Kitasatospora paranensis TaxID=258053 RepID=A0ABW2FYN6_9ACTN
MISTVRNDRENAPSRFTARAAINSRTVRGKLFRLCADLTKSAPSCVTDETDIVGCVGTLGFEGVTGQVMFDGHVVRLLDTAVSLVNALTDGARQGRPYAAPNGDRLPSAVHEALQLSPRAEVGSSHAVYLANTAQQMRAVFAAVDGGHMDQAAQMVNALLRTTGARPQLDRVDGEPWQVHFHGSDDSLSVGWSAGCATALALAIGSDLAGRLGVCTAPHCDRVYVDASRNAVRHFCSTACRGRVKAAAFRARKASRD